MTVAASSPDALPCYDALDVCDKVLSGIWAGLRCCHDPNGDNAILQVSSLAVHHVRNPTRFVEWTYGTITA